MMHRTSLLGNVGGDAELGKTRGGTDVLNFSVAVNEKYTNKKNEEIEDTYWYDVEIFGSRGVALEKFITKGMPIFVEGRLRAEAWNAKEAKSGDDPKKKMILTVANYRDAVQFISGGKSRDETDEANKVATAEELFGSDT